MIDAEKLVHDLLIRDCPIEVTIKPDIDVGVMNEFPLVAFSVVVGQSIDNHAPPSGWTATLALNVFESGDNSLDAAKALSFVLYDIVWAWRDVFGPGGIISGVGYVHDVADQSIFTRIGTVEVANKWVTQYAGSFDLVVRPPQ